MDSNHDVESHNLQLRSLVFFGYWVPMKILGHFPLKKHFL